MCSRFGHSRDMKEGNFVYFYQYLLCSYFLLSRGHAENGIGNRCENVKPVIPHASVVDKTDGPDLMARTVSFEGKMEYWLG